MNCKKDCKRLYKSPQGDCKCYTSSDDFLLTPLKVEAGKPQRHWLCERISSFSEYIPVVMSSVTRIGCWKRRKSIQK